MENMVKWRLLSYQTIQEWDKGRFEWLSSSDYRSTGVKYTEVDHRGKKEWYFIQWKTFHSKSVLDY